MRLSSLKRKLLRDPLILPFYLPALILSFSEGLLIPTLPLYAADFQVSYSWIGIILAAQGLGTLLSDVPGGMLLRRLGQRWAMLIGLAATALSTAALFWTRSIPELILYRVVSGFGLALFGVARHAYVADAVRISDRGQMMSLLGGMFRIGHFFGPALGGAIAAIWGLRLPFLIFGIACGLACASVAAFVRGAWTTSHAATREPQIRGRELLGAFRGELHLLIPGGLGQVFASMIRAGRGPIITLYAANVLGLDVAAIGWLTTLAASVEMLCFYPAGWIMDHLGRKVSIVPSFALQGLVMAFVPLTHSFAGLLLCAAAIGAANGLSSGAMLALGVDLAPRRIRGEYLGVWRLIGDIGATGGPSVVGFVADSFTLPGAALAMTAAGLLAASIFGFLLPETLQKPAPLVQPATGE